MSSDTAAKSLQSVVDSVVNYVKPTHIPWANWYVGIASNPRSRLFVDHNVQERDGYWIYDNAGSERGARIVEKFLLDTYGTKGDTGGGDATTTWVYAYAITQTTRE